MLNISYFLAPVTWFTFVLGAIVGSFLNVCIFRIPEGTFLKEKRSVCRQCGKLIPFYNNIPILSFFFLKGKSACCQTRLSWQYPLVELATAAIFAWLYWKFPFVIGYNEGWEIDNANVLRYAHAVVFSCILLVCSVIDLRLMIIPDRISIPMIVLTPLIVWLHPDLDWRSALFGIVLGGGSLYLIAWIYYLVRREIGMGFGDVKLLAGIGGWLGYQAILPTIFIASVVGSIVGLTAIVINRKMDLKSAIPFGPFLAAGAFLYFTIGEYLNEWLLRIQG